MQVKNYNLTSQYFIYLFFCFCKNQKIKALKYFGDY